MSVELLKSWTDRMPEYKPFEFTDEFLERLREIKKIPVHFYNREGQILIYKKENATEEEIRRLARFQAQGIYYNEADSEKLEIVTAEEEIPEGLSGTKLISQHYTDELTQDMGNLFDEMKKTSLTSQQMEKTSGQMEEFFLDFASQEDAMNGLVNILEAMQSKKMAFDVELAVKRTIVAMALRTRGMHDATNMKERKALKKSITDLMISALLCDVGYSQMNMPESTELSTEEMGYVKLHPFYSYLMVAHEPTLSSQIKQNILTHHRPYSVDRNNNNYPRLDTLRNKMVVLNAECQKNPAKRHLTKDITSQIELLKVYKTYNETTNVLAVSSEFASLTSNVPWRQALSPINAIKTIINNSFFTYTGRVMREFLDYIAISLCDNKKILKEGDFIVIDYETADEKHVFEACRIESVGRFQSRPGVRRIATVKPELTKVPKLRVKGFDSKSLNIDRRKAYYELTQDDSRRIVYVVNPQFDADLHGALIDTIVKYF